MQYKKGGLALDCFKILVADDEAFIRRTIVRILESEGMLTFQAGNGPEAVDMCQKQEFDLIILDIMMEGMDGFEVLSSLRSLGVLTPVIVLSGRQEDQDKIFALGIGADDYITKPFSLSVLCAKVKACLRRTRISSAHAASIIELEPFRYICDEMRLQKNGEEIFLSSKESLLMKYFISNPNKVLTKEQIYNAVWGNSVVDDNTIMVHIRHLRMKIEDNPNQPDFIRTVRGIGYQFAAK